jgi:hypothetical protein
MTEYSRIFSPEVKFRNFHYPKNIYGTEYMNRFRHSASRSTANYKYL